MIKLRDGQNAALAGGNVVNTKSKGLKLSWRERIILGFFPSKWALPLVIKKAAELRALEDNGNNIPSADCPKNKDI